MRIRPKHLRTALRSPSVAVAAAGVLVAALALALTTGPVAPSTAATSGTGPVDEIHYSYGDSPDSVVLDWRGSESTVFFGPTRDYGQQATGHHSAITPANGSGTYREAVLTGLQPGTTYHYRIGANGEDHTLAAAPTGDFSWVDVGDTMSTSCGRDGSWMSGTHALIAAQDPDLVTHGGDIAVPNQCGLDSLHQYYEDQEVWSTGAAFQLALGNHEYGTARAHVAGAIDDSLSNYKGRSFLTHGQTVPADRPGRTTAPGCGAEVGSTRNTCKGEDWGWFRAGGVLFISYPEPSRGAWSDWATKAAGLMARAQDDPSVDFVVTWGHRPAWSTSAEGPDLALRAVLESLARRFSPTGAHPTGKYVLTVGHHAHGMEVFAPIGGLISITAAAGGQGLVPFTRSDPRSKWRTRHLGVLAGEYDASRGELVVSLKCGGVFRDRTSDRCTYGGTLFTTRFRS